MCVCVCVALIDLFSRYGMTETTSGIISQHQGGSSPGKKMIFIPMLA